MENKKFENEELPKNFRMCVLGSSGSGKTTFTLRWLSQYRKKKNNTSTCATNSFISVITPEHNEETYEKIADKIFTIETFDEVLNAIDAIKEFQKTSVDEKGNYKYHHIVIFDDVVSQKVKDDEINVLFASSRHLNMSIIFISQSFYVMLSRFMKQNLTHYAIMRISEASIIRQVCNGPIYNVLFDMKKKDSELKTQAMELYDKHVQKKKHGGILIDIEANKMFFF